MHAVLDHIFETTTAEQVLAGDIDRVDTLVYKRIVMRWFIDLPVSEARNTPIWPLAVAWLTDRFPDGHDPTRLLINKMKYERTK